MRYAILMFIGFNWLQLSGQRMLFTHGEYRLSEEQLQLIQTVNPKNRIDSITVKELIKIGNYPVKQYYKRTFYLSSGGMLDSLIGDEIELRFKYDSNKNITKISAVNKTKYKFLKDTSIDFTNSYDSLSRFVKRTSSDSSSTIEICYRRDTIIKTIKHCTPKPFVQCMRCIYNYNDFDNIARGKDIKELSIYSPSGKLKKTIKTIDFDTSEIYYYYNSDGKIIDQYEYNVSDKKLILYNFITLKYNFCGNLKRINIYKSNRITAEIKMHPIGRPVIKAKYYAYPYKKKKIQTDKIIFHIDSH